LAIESHSRGWSKFHKLAQVWKPSRDKGIQVSKEFGVPFLAATQVFDARPIPRKWLVKDQTDNLDSRFVKHGMILVTCSGSVGRSIVACNPHLDKFITNDLIRVESIDSKYWGWIYSYLRASKTRAMMKSSRYGHIIKHLETNHLKELPIPDISETVLERFNNIANQVLDLRDQAYAATLAAEAHYEKCVGSYRTTDSGELGFVVNSTKTIFQTRLRLDASRHNPLAINLWAHLTRAGKLQPLSECGFKIWVPGRYKRIPASDGVIFLDSSDLFETSPDTDKMFADGEFGDKYKGRVEPGWLLMASSGQVYGIVGGVVLASQFYVGKVVANHVIRIAPTTKATARPGYVLVALTHPNLGTPLIKALTFGSSVPEISPIDVAQFGIARLNMKDEDTIADLAEKSAELRGKADILENQLALEADDIINNFLIS
jgi:hypothetical protein